MATSLHKGGRICLLTSKGRPGNGTAFFVGALAPRVHYPSHIFQAGGVHVLLKLLRTRDDYLLTLLRVALGIVFFAHGAQKVMGWWGGAGFSGTMAFFTHGLGIPTVFAGLAILAEFLGGIGLVLGLLTRVAAFGITVNMIVAIFLVHAPNGLFMNWSGNQRGEGFEFHLLAIAIAATLIARGAGAWSLDRLLQKVLGSARIPIHYRQPLPHHG
jgi:putative oxidoreductase